MRILWVRREPVLSGGGDAIVDEKFTRQLSRSHDVTVHVVARRSSFQRWTGMVARRVPPDRSSFGTEADVAEICRLAREGCQSIVFSHEQLDALAVEVGKRFRPGRRPHVALLLHNVPSDALPQLSARRAVGSLAGAVWRAYERRSFRSEGIDDVFTLSKRDAALVAKLSGRRTVPTFHPGAPNAHPLADGAGLQPDLVVSGTFEWFPKLRDLRSFAAEYRDWTRRPKPRIYISSGLSDELRHALDAQDVGTLDLGSAIRFGLVTDRFVAGHKLKVSEYFAANLIPISFSEVGEDFEFSAAATRLISTVGDIAAMSARIDEFERMPRTALHVLFAEAKRDVLDELSWARQAGRMADYIEGSLTRGGTTRGTVGEMDLRAVHQ